MQETEDVKFVRRAAQFCWISYVPGNIGAFFAPVWGRRPTLPFPVKMFAYRGLGFGNIEGQLGKYLLGLRLIRSHSRANGLIRAPGSRTDGRISGIVSRCRHVAGNRSPFVTDSQIEREGSYRQ